MFPKTAVCLKQVGGLVYNLGDLKAGHTLAA